MNLKVFVIIAVVSCFFSGCKKTNDVSSSIAAIPVSIEIERFDKLFSKVNEQNLTVLKEDFPFLFPEKYDDTIWLSRASDTIQQEVNKEVLKVFPNLSKEKKEIESLLQHVKYYFPEITTPRVITITSDVDYQNRIILTEELLLISLDTYLGKDHHFYSGIQNYIKNDFSREHIISDIATMYAKKFVPIPRDRTFVASMIYYGKELYLKNLFLPEMDAALKMGYTQEELEWVQANEEAIWRHFIEKQLLYSTEKGLDSRFLFPAPFSKFYLEEIDKEAPDRVGQFIGWNIVKSYMKDNTSISVRQLLATDAETIFNNSNYKPARS